jgi:hypothetical protein
MPNWVHNYMKIAGAAEEIERFKKTCITGEGEDGLDFNAIIPMPAEVEGNHAKGENGMPVWYEWTCANWGTKWNAIRFCLEKDEATCFECSFDTAWAPPVPVWKKMGEMFPTLDFELGGSEPINDTGFGGGIRSCMKSPRSGPGSIQGLERL